MDLQGQTVGIPEEGHPFVGKEIHPDRFCFDSHAVQPGNCRFYVIPMKGKITSLNASAAASILLYEAVRQRLN